MLNEDIATRQIRTEVEFRDWVGKQSKKVNLQIASRSALRISHLSLTSQDTALACFRCILIGFVTTAFPDDDFSYFAAASAKAAEKMLETLRGDVENFANTALSNTTLDPARMVALSVVNLDEASMGVAYVGHMETTLSATTPGVPAIYLDCESGIDGVLERPLWIDLDHSYPQTQLADLPAENAHFTFWRDWYQGFLDGKPLDWELQRRVALIPDNDWEKGPEHIAGIIEEIRARFELEKRIEALEAEKSVWEERARHGVGGNNPPEPFESERIVQEIIWAPIEDLKAETQSDTPDKSRIRTAISKLGAALIAVGKWSVEKLDAAADAFAKSLGGGLGGYCVGWIIQNSDKIAEVIRTAQAWLSALI